MDINEQINEMAEALEEAMAVQQKYAAALKKLKEENQFLADTITNNKLGKISTERRQLLDRVSKTEYEARTAIKESNAIKSEYEQKLNKIIPFIRDINSKQADIDTYIDSKAKIVSDKYKAENDALLQEQLNKYKKQHKIIIICGVIGIIVGILGFIF